jgi:uncharacterized protein
MSDRPFEPASASDSPGSGITVTGSGRAAAAPDVFVATFAAQASRARPADAMDAAAGGLTRMRTAALALGATADGMTTRSITLQQDWNHQEGRPSGFVASVVLSVRTTALGSAASLLSGCIEAGGDEARLEGTSFEHADPGALLVAARDVAFADALARARQLAKLAGRRLGSVLSIEESAPGYAPVARLAMKSMADSMPIDPGAVDAAVSVTVRWSFTA